MSKKFCIEDAVALIQIERDRQIAHEGWTASHDDRHIAGQLEDAAECYWQTAVKPGHVLAILGGSAVPRWPWDWTWFKPWDHQHRGYFPLVDGPRCMVKAGALLMAERDRQGRRGDSTQFIRLQNRIMDVAAAINAGFHQDAPSEIELLRQQVANIERLTGLACTIQVESAIGQPNFAVVDVDGVVIARGNTIAEAAANGIAAVAGPPCTECGGSGSVDSGGFSPQGQPIEVPCPFCSEK